MKKLITLSILLLSITLSGLAQKNTVAIDVTDLTPQQLAKMKVDEMRAQAEAETKKALAIADKQVADLERKIETYGDWVGVGGEVGVAVREGMMAIIDVADKFAGTDIGKYTMVLIAWKVIGDDLSVIGFKLLGILIWLSIMVMIWKMYKRLCFERKVRKTKMPFWKRMYKEVEYDIKEPVVSDEGGIVGVSAVTVIVVALLTLIFWANVIAVTPADIVG